MGLHHHQIGEVAERTGLSLRTLRYYDEVGLVTPATRSHGGFRLYSEADVARLELIKRLKPLDFSLEDVRALLAALDALDTLDADGAPAPERDALLERLDVFRLAAEARCAGLRTQLESAESVATSLRREMRRLKRVPEVSR